MHSDNSLEEAEVLVEDSTGLKSLNVEGVEKFLLDSRFVAAS